MRRLIRWLWRYRWPGAPLTLVAFLIAVQYVWPADDYHLIDKGIVAGVAVALLALLVVLVIATPRPWTKRATGILLLVLADLTLYAYLILPATFGWTVPFPHFATYFLRGNLAVGAPVLILGYSDWGLDRWRSWRGHA